jgi:hypothetical protein
MDVTLPAAFARKPLSGAALGLIFVDAEVRNQLLNEFQDKTLLL